jgi:hypothetical protein
MIQIGLSYEMVDDDDDDRYWMANFMWHRSYLIIICLEAMLGSTQDAGLKVNEMCMCLHTHSCTNFPKIQDPSKNLSCQMGNMKQGQFWESTNVRCHSTKYSHPGSLMPRICVWLCVHFSSTGFKTFRNGCNEIEEGESEVMWCFMFRMIKLKGMSQ